MKEPRVDFGRDTESFARIVREHQKAVFSIAYAKLGNAHDAEDIKQEVFIEAWRNLSKLTAREKVQAWLFTVTINRCKDYLRKKFRRERREVVYMESSPQEFKDIQDDPEVYEKVLRAVSDLPEKIRIVIMLRHLAQLSYDEISRMTGLSKTTIDGRLRMGKMKMRQRLRKLETE